jgi:hypothetical protein
MGGGGGQSNPAAGFSPAAEQAVGRRAIDERNIDVFQIFRRRIVNDRRGIDAARRE